MISITIPVYNEEHSIPTLVEKITTVCKISGHQVSDHFADVGKTINMPKGAEKEISEIMLTRYAC